jgi:hypothetical protein
MREMQDDVAAGSDAQAAVRVVHAPAAKAAAAAAAGGAASKAQVSREAVQQSGFPMLDKFLRSLDLTQVRDQWTVCHTVYHR